MTLALELGLDWGPCGMASEVWIREGQWPGSVGGLGMAVGVSNK
jgi:hypothetical protein